MNAPEPLELWLEDERLGLLFDRGMGFVALEFTDEARERHGAGARVLSLSLPVSDVVPTEVATQFLRGLLPEGRALERIAQQLQLSTLDTFGLLRELGRDCAGALVIAPAGTAERMAPRIDWLDEHRLAERLSSLPTDPLGLTADGDVRLSLAGVQDKLVVRIDPETGRVGLPLDGAPSTHILKPASLAERDGVPQTPGLVENECFCLAVARRAGVPVATATLRSVEGTRVLVVERFDRVFEDGEPRRIHQEDSCQALGVDPLLKYEEQGGPSLGAVAGLLRSFAAEPLRDLRHLLDLTLLNCVLGNLDAHGKNLAILHRADGSVALAPAYDLVSVAIYPAFAGGRLAMRIGAAERLEDVDLSALLAAYAAAGLPERAARRRIPAVLAAVDRALEESLDHATKEGWHIALLDEIAGEARRRIEALSS